MTDKSLTRRQIEALEAIYHGGYPWDRCTNGETWQEGVRSRTGGARHRMVDTLQLRGYFTREYKLTAKGYAALSESKAAMQFIDRAELETRWQTRQQEEYDALIAAEEERRQRAERQRIAEETSRRERLAKLRPVMEGEAIDLIDWNDERLLAFAERVHEIMEVY